jgi:hypothetical protein
MSEHDDKQEELEPDELEETDGELLPEREVMTILPVPGEMQPPPLMPIDE